MIADYTKRLSNCNRLGDAKLEVGSAAEIVRVTAQEAVLQRDSSVLTTVIISNTANYNPRLFQFALKYEF